MSANLGLFYCFAVIIAQQHNVAAQLSQVAAPDEFCKDGYLCPNSRKCIEKKQICNGVTDCQDASDEFNCPSRRCIAEREFPCSGSSACIALEFVCDGDKDCRAGDDEEYCSKDCNTENEFVCGKRCIPKTKVCQDGIPCKSPEVAVECPKLLQELAAGSNQTFVIALSVGIVFCLIVIIALAICYVRQRKIASSRLSPSEIAYFMNGAGKNTRRLSRSTSKTGYDSADQLPYDKRYELPPTRYQIDAMGILGSGAFGLVYRAVVDGKVTAAKTVKPNVDKAYLKALLSELKIHIYLDQHENIVRLVGSSTASLRKGIAYVFVEFCELGNLQKYLAKWETNGGPFRPSEYMEKWALDIARGMEYLAYRSVIHGDLACRNVLLTSTGTAKVTDFGLSRQLYNYSVYTKTNQEPLPWRWMALESLKHLTFSHKSDVWAFGITLWEMYSMGQVPYPGASCGDVFMVELEAGLRPPRPSLASEEMYDLMSKCWRKMPQERPEFGEIVQILKSTVGHTDNDACDEAGVEGGSEYANDCRKKEDRRVSVYVECQ